MRTLSGVLAVAVATAFGCLSSSFAQEESAPTVKPATDISPAQICGQCGEVKGSARCCQEGAGICEHCGLHKGSPGCCAAGMTQGKDARTCPQCGDIAVEGHRCDMTGKTVCPSCGLFRGSPGCKAKCSK
jgi:hypothetical protein